jgi:hypothetical protein
MVFGDSVEEMVFKATEQLPVEIKSLYEAALIIACPVGYKRRLTPIWHIGEELYNMGWRHYGKVTFTLKATARQSFPIQEELF